jgi:TRAP-type C4-dicarboxylate transport system permease small subunit
MKYELIFPNSSHVWAAKEVGVGVSVGGQSKFYYKTYIQAVYNYSIQLGSSLAVLMIIYAGYKYLTSRGDSSALSEAKDIFAGALLGLAVLLLIRLILNFIGLPTENISGGTTAP